LLTGKERSVLRKYFELKCDTCGKIYELPESALSKLRSDGKSFCSRACNDSSKKHHPSKEMTQICLGCGVSFTYKLYAGDHLKKYCDRKCYRRYLSKNPPTARKQVFGKFTNGGGYVCVYVPPNTPGALRYAKCKHSKKTYMLEHRLVMQQILGRPLKKTETIHHKNGNREDNRPENLELRYGNHGKGGNEYTSEFNKLSSENYVLCQTLITLIEMRFNKESIDV
jgi:hypothetical protein